MPAGVAGSGLRLTADVVGAIAADGFLLVDGDDFRMDAACATALEEFTRTWRDLPPDRYLPDGASYRRRRHARFLLDTDGGRLRRVPGAGYFQTATVNPLVGGIVRRFDPFSDEQADNLFMHSIIRCNAELFAACSRTVPTTWEIDAHQIRVTAGAGTVGRPSPEGRHRDGFDFIALHHVARRNVTGGRTEIFDNDGVLLARRVLCDRLDSVYADDARVLHDVTPVALGPDGPDGHRDMLLMSFTARGGK
ncbi:2OG-Fe dioxygenase family protein [Plantactinospora sp. S1510]|uniref:2OG-Fe dioxygenase family protein n=1 Tax=Plantactinospora alkalitolerans TaxID=2789879 RepID=A0ABS0H4H5_9ACTN|nr:2OG-Fe dioxygenase family protein [Plantactinospora alkalitolerans]MBF9133361.1 2OG-Fe dioxygenase family protein [Plantactinospora alkalitolerans]